MASGADEYLWDTFSFEEAILTVNPTYAPTGNAISTRRVAGIENPVTVAVSGSLYYTIPGSGAFASCSTAITATASEFDLPVLTPNFIVPPVSCEGGTVEFSDLNEGDAPNSTSYTFFASTGLDSDNVPTSSTSFEVIADSTVFRVTKSQLYVQGEESLVCSSRFDSTFVVLARPTVALQDLVPSVKGRKPRWLTR